MKGKYQVIFFDGDEENDEKYKKLEEQWNDEKRRIEEMRNHALAMTLLNDHGGICPQPTNSIEKTHKKGWGTEFDTDNPFSYKEEFSVYIKEN